MWKNLNYGTVDKLDLSKPIPVGFYTLVNLSVTTINAPIVSNASCVIISNDINELLIATDKAFIYGRYKYTTVTEWVKLF